jgi:DNA-binding transcriptional ArsR family regulator
LARQLKQHKYQEEKKKENRRLVLWWIINGYEGPNIDEGTTFQELGEVTGLSPPTLSSHLKSLQREGLIEVKHFFPADRLAYVVVDRKAELMNLLFYFIQQEKSVRKEYSAELERLQQSTDQLQAALKPFGKLPKEIQNLMQEMEEMQIHSKPIRD